MYGVELALQRRLAVLVATTLAGFCFYKCLLQCVWSQMSHFDESRPSPDVDLRTGEEVDDWKHIQSKWNMKRRIYATTALVYFETGMYLLPLAMMPLLPPGLLALALYIWLLSLVSFFFKHYSGRKRFDHYSLQKKAADRPKAMPAVPGIRR